MRFWTTLALSAATASLVMISGMDTASAREPDGARIRYGVAVEGGGLFSPGIVDLGTLGLQAQLGVQFNHLVGVYVAPSFDIVGGDRHSGFQIGGALLIDFTIHDFFTIGIGPDLAGFTTMGRGELAGGVLFGSRLHLALNPIVGFDRNGVRRRALMIGVDLRLVTAGGAAVLSSRGGAADEIVASPTLMIGYQAF